MTKKYLLALALALAGCGGKQTGSDPGASDTLALKKAAAEAATKQVSGGASTPPASEDVCAKHSWYGDGVCDSFCAKNDSDCVQNGTSTVCAEFIELEDGTCSRPETDPCRFQDPDCAGETPPSAGSGGGVACALISEVSDGVCKRPDTDACRFQDPDCQPPTGGGSSGSSGTGVACPAIAEIANGKCERPADDPCRSIDPDCVVACAEYIEQSDGVCKRDAFDPCIFQDPDCKAK
ncbi:MAG TPA: hypothetical protein VGJ91_00755 [Polyangiaceae bacterium]